MFESCLGKFLILSVCENVSQPDAGRNVLEEDTNQAVCHLSYCLILGCLQDDVLAEAVLTVDD